MRAFLIILLVVSVSDLFGQNMVTNHSFEKRTSNPRTFAQFRRVIDWGVPNFSTPDFYCCGKVYYAGEENTKLGNIEAAEGEAFAGLVIYSKDNEDYHEYIYTQLSDTLSADSKYRISFQAYFEPENAYHADGFGLALSNRFEFEETESDYEVHSKDYPKGQWVTISVDYEASGGESHLFIGTFKRPDDMDVIKIDRKMPFKQTYVYVDDVEVIALD